MTYRALLNAVAAGMACAVLAACASSDLVKVQPGSRGQIDSISVSQVEVHIQTPRPYPKLRTALLQELQAQLATCARGNTPHVARVTITEFEEQNVAKSILIGDEIELGGKVQFVNAGSGAQAGEYYVKESFYWGGLVGAAIMSNATKNLSRDFAKSVCNKVLKG